MQAYLLTKINGDTRCDTVREWERTVPSSSNSKLTLVLHHRLDYNRHVFC